MSKTTIGGFVAGLGAALIVVLAVSILRADSEIDAFAITDAEPYRCEGDDVAIYDRGDLRDDDFLVEFIELRPGLDCRFRFWVANDGDEAIVVETIDLPFLGDDSGLGLNATSLNPRYNAPSPLEPLEERDSTWPVADDQVGPGQRVYYEVWLEFDTDACQAAGGMMSVPGPLVFVAGSDEPLPYTGPPIAAGGVGFNEC